MLFADVEQRLAETSRLNVAERRKELEQMDPAVVALTREFERFQMIAFNKFPEEIDRMEEQLTRIQETISRMQLDDITISGLQNEQKLQQSDVVADEMDPTTQLVNLTNAKLEDGKARALNMLKMANTMRDELNMMDDEVMLQREKLVSINAQIKHAQSVTNQTKKLVSYFTKAVNDDKIVKGLIVVVAVLLMVIMGMAVSIKMKKGKLVEQKTENEKVAVAKADYSRIDEKYFYDIMDSMGGDIMSKPKDPNRVKWYKKGKLLANKKTNEVENEAKSEPTIVEDEPETVTEDVPKVVEDVGVKEEETQPVTGQSEDKGNETVPTVNEPTKTINEPKDEVEAATEPLKEESESIPLQLA